MRIDDFPKTRTLKVVRWLYDHLLSTLSLAFWTCWAGRYYGLEFCRAARWPITPSGRGLSKPLEFKRLLRRGLITDQDILLIGAGGGEEALPWLLYKPKSVCAMDLQDYRIGWKHLTRNASEPPLHFVQSDAGKLPFRDASFDLLTSFATLEHIVPLQNHMREAHRVLRPEGCYYAVFGPLWRTYKGSHLDSLGYSHLLVSENELQRLAKASDDREKEWLEKGLLNRCRYEDYMNIFKPYFNVEYQAWTLSNRGLQFRRENPLVWERLRKQYSEQDLLLSTVNLLLRKRV